MAMKTNEIERVFKEYIEASNVNYAFFLNGAWGSGKTYFWNNTLKKIAEDKGLKVVTISLYGINDIEMLDRRLRNSLITPTFTALGETESKAFTAVHAVAKGIKQFVSGKVNINIDKIVQEISIDAYIDDNILICFDDLERSNIKKDLVLGYINNLIENKSAKIIILGNQSEIIDPKIQKDEAYEDAKNYLKIKEKCIRWTFDLDPEIDKIFDAFHGNLKNTSLKEFLLKNKDNICNLFEEYGGLNFRIMNFYFDILEKIYPKFYDQIDLIKNEIIFYSFICVVETVNGTLNISRIDEFKNLQDSIGNELYKKEIVSYLGKKDATSVQTPINDYWGKYFRHRYYKFHEYYSIVDFVLMGNFKEEKLLEEILERRNNINLEENVILEKIATPYFRNYTNEDFNSYIDKFLNYLTEGRYPLHRYKMIAYWLEFYVDNDFIKLSKNDLINKLKNGMKLASKSDNKINEEIFKRALKEYNDSSIANEINVELTKLYKLLLHDETIKDLESLYDTLTKTEINESQLKMIFDKNIHNRNFLLDINIVKFSNALINATPNKIQLFKFEIWNYLSTGNFLDDYPKILKKISSLKSEIQKGMKNLHDKPVSRFNLKELIAAFDEKLIPALKDKRPIMIE